MFSKMVLQNSMGSDKGYVSSDASYHQLLGSTGVAVNTLRPSGKVSIDNNIYNAQAATGFIEKNKAVVVIKVEMGLLFVKEST